MKNNGSLAAMLVANDGPTRPGEALGGRDLVGANLGGADLRNAHLEDVFLERCDLTGADLRGAHFILCDFCEVVMTGVRLGDNRFDGTLFRGVVGLTEEDAAAIVRAGGFLQPRHASLR
jgi:uncharacterized protein YjbI with pentapeptide repeats